MEKIGDRDATTLRQVVQQKWSIIEHYDKLDQNLLIAVLALSGAAIAVIQIEDSVGCVIAWFAVSLAAAVITACLRSFVGILPCFGSHFSRRGSVTGRPDHW